MSATETPAVVDANGKVLKGAALKKFLKQQEAAAEAVRKEAELLERFVEVFGVRPLMQSQGERGVKFTELSQLNLSLVGAEVIIRARMASARSKGKLAFVTLRAGLETAQLTISSDKHVIIFSPNLFLSFFLTTNIILKKLPA